MGQFSWITSDTDRSVLCNGSVPVKMLSPDGRVFEERGYEGYGVFGDKDYFVLVAELNGLGDNRQDGIDLLFKDNSPGDPMVASERGVKLPKIVSINAQGSWGDYAQTKSCPEQGWRQYDEPEDTCSWCGEDPDHCGCDEDDEYL